MTEKNAQKIDWNQFKGLSETEIDDKVEEILSMLTLKEKTSIKEQLISMPFLLVMAHSLPGKL